MLKAAEATGDLEATLDDMAKTLQVKPAVLRNIINGANSKLNKMYKFERILNNEN